MSNDALTAYTGGQNVPFGKTLGEDSDGYRGEAGRLTAIPRDLSRSVSQLHTKPAPTGLFFDKMTPESHRRESR